MTVKVAVVWVAVGVPLMTPVVLSRLRPAGSAGLMAYVTAPVEPVAVNAEVAVSPVPTLPVTV